MTQPHPNFFTFFHKNLCQIKLSFIFVFGKEMDNRFKCTSNTAQRKGENRRISGYVYPSFMDDFKRELHII